ncbi:MAG: hypothetical protein AAF702_45360 [Chloroflexota bacterium]
MTILTTGQTLDGNGQPLADSGFEVKSGSRFAQLLNQRTSPIFSRPASGEWFFELGRTQNGNGLIERVVAISRPGNAGPPEHIHTGYDEIVDVVQGAFVVVERSGEKNSGLVKLL